MKWLTIYREPRQITPKLKQKRFQFASHCHWTVREVVSSWLLGYASGGDSLQKLTFHTMAWDSGLDILGELETSMQDQSSKGLLGGGGETQRETEIMKAIILNAKMPLTCWETSPFVAFGEFNIEKADQSMNIVILSTL